MGDENRWTEVLNYRKIKRQSKRNAIENEKKKWEDLRKRCPHIILPSRAHRIRFRLNIDHLDEFLLSERCIDYQLEGWHYVKVVKPNDQQSIPQDTDLEIFSLLSVNNGWGDKILFKKSSEDISIDHIRDEEKSTQDIST